MIAFTLMACSGAAAFMPARAVPLQHYHSLTCTGSAPVMSTTPTRRQAAQALLFTAFFPVAAVAGDGKPATWISGKSDPIRPTSKDKPDGTKKDGKYLSCLNDCVPRKQGPPGPSQLERADCLDACQQECCTTYEQCTYTIRKF